jgi:type IV pilus assembly protein PilY1
MRFGLRHIIFFLTFSILVFPFTLPARADTCVDISDVPLDARISAAPANIMFVLDDSGSMDWEFMTEEDQGVYHVGYSKYYWVFDNPGDNLPYGSSYILSSSKRDRWKSQWSGYNRMYYDPSVDYEPWPTRDDADSDEPYSHPMHSRYKLNLSSQYCRIDHISIKNAHYYVWSDLENKPYLVMIDGTTIKYYKVTGLSGSGSTQQVTGLDGPTSPPDDVQSTRSYADERQNFANWYSFYRRRELAATAAVSNVIASMQGVQIGILTINGNLKQPVLKVKVRGVDETTALLTSLYNLTLRAEGTPLRRGLQNVGKYFHQDDGSTGGLGTSPYASAADGGECQQAFAIVMTDGYWNGSSPSVGNVDKDEGEPYADNWSDTLADVAMYYYKNDLSRGLDDLVPTNPMDDAAHQHMVTYSVSFGVSGTLDPDDYDLESGPYPEWPKPKQNESTVIDDLWHAAVNGRGIFVSASDPQELVNSLVSIMSNIGARIGSVAPVSINGDELYGELGQDIRMFQSTYFSDGWTGDVKSYEINTSTGQVITSSSVWSAADRLENVTWDNRVIATYDGSAGKPFRFDSLTDTQKNLLNPDATAAENILKFLRGDSSNEEQNGGTFRNRFKKLGDIVHSSPLYVNGVLYAGGNDGMLHAFSASDGTELFAYVPNLVFGNLKELADPDYSHVYYVDLTPAAKSGITMSGGNQITLLVGGLGKGGKGYYALDISSPSTMTTEDTVAGKVMWEYPKNSTPQGEIDDLGYSYCRATILDSNDSNVGCIVIFGNGYESANGHAVLFILKPSDGTLLKKIDTGVGSCNGLSTTIQIDVNYDDKVDYVYAGDLKGNLWKFDLTSSNYSDWDVAYKDGTTPQPLFQAKGPAGTTQPITTKPDVMFHCDEDGYMIIFATGKYLGDNDSSDVTTQSIYGVWDYGDDDDNSEYVGSFNRDSTPQLSNQPDTVTLLQQQIVPSQEEDSNFWTVNGSKFRILTDNDPVWETESDQDSTEQEPRLPNPSSTVDNHVGWYFDLPIIGERVVTDTLIREQKAIVITFNPEGDPCSCGGDSIVMEMDACTGGRLKSAQFDVNDDEVIDEQDLINIGTVDVPICVGPTGVLEAEKGRLQTPPILRMGKQEIKYFGSSSGEIITVREKAARIGMVYWMEFK